MVVLVDSSFPRGDDAGARLRACKRPMLRLDLREGVDFGDGTSASAVNVDGAVASGDIGGGDALTSTADGTA